MCFSRGPAKTASKLSCFDSASKRIASTSKEPRFSEGNQPLEGQTLYHWATLTRPAFSFDAKMRMAPWVGQPASVRANMLDAGHACAQLCMLDKRMHLCWLLYGQARESYELIRNEPVRVFGIMSLGVDFPFFSTIVLSKNQPFSLGFRRFSRKIRIDPWKEWKWKVPLDMCLVQWLTGWLVLLWSWYPWVR